MNEESLSVHIEYSWRYNTPLHRRSCGDSFIGGSDGDGGEDAVIHVLYGTTVEYLEPIY